VDAAMVWAVVIAAVVFGLDMWLPLGVASAMPFTFAVLAALESRSRRFAVGLMLVCCGLTVAKAMFFPERGNTELWKVVVNRGLTLFAIGMTFVLGLKRKHADEEREQAQEKVRLHLADAAYMARLTTADQLAWGVAHELNQPLSAVCLQADVAAEQLRADAVGSRGQVLSALHEIAEQAGRAGTILKSLRDWVRKTESRRAAVDLAALIAQAVRLMDVHARRVGATVSFDALGPLPPAAGDRIQLEQVVLNLLQNALDAVAVVNGPRTVEVSARSDDRRFLVVTVRDTGVGLPSADSQQVFERFFTTKPAGMGLGLAISRSIVESHGGCIRAEAAAGGGSVFSFSVPIFRSAQ
jgi:C4-dicarboxylate-specific signal transduction histidine kinase